MKKQLIDLVMVGADRIAGNGDTANKIGTYSLAVLARHHGIPFYVAAPLSTFDFTLNDGSQIPVEERNPEEVTGLYGQKTEVLLLDEPTTGLDNNTKTKLIQVIKSLSISLIAVSHEFDFLEAATNKIYTLEDGKIHMDKEVYLHHHEHAHIMGRQPHRHI